MLVKWSCYSELLNKNFVFVVIGQGVCKTSGEIPYCGRRRKQQAEGCVQEILERGSWKCGSLCSCQKIYRMLKISISFDRTNFSYGNDTSSSVGFVNFVC